MKRYSTPISLAVAAVVFVAMFLALGSATDAIRLGGPAVLALAAALGVQLLLSRTPAEITDDSYHDDAQGQADACLELVRRLRKASQQVRSPGMHHEVEQVATVVPELLRRVGKASPTSLYSSASQLREHLTSLLGVVETYADIERNPAFYPQPQAQLAAGEQAVQRFVAFSLDSIRLVNQGDLASYKANLATAAPPEMPTLFSKEQ